MNIKKKLLGSAATIALASMATIGGTFAYFSDSSETTSKFTNGTIVLSPNSPWLENFNIRGFKPGDVLEAKKDNQEPAMILNNQGTLPFEVFMKVTLDGTELSQSGDSTANHIIVKSLAFGGEDLLQTIKNGMTEEVDYLTLAQVAAYFNAGDTEVNGQTVEGVGQYIGYLDPGKNLDGSDKENPWNHGAIKAVTYELEFVDNNQDQNHLQGLETRVGFEFNAMQFDGTTYNSTNLTNEGQTYQNNVPITGDGRD